MYVYSKNSRILHTNLCCFAKRIHPENARYFHSLGEARAMKLCGCRMCSLIAVRARKEKKELTECAKKYNISYHFCPEDNTIEVKTTLEKWKIMYLGRNKVLKLFHQSELSYEGGGMLPGYHEQNMNSKTLLGFFEYIGKHNAHRRANPLYMDLATLPPRKGTKRYRKEQKRIERIKRKKAIVRVQRLIDEVCAAHG